MAALRRVGALPGQEVAVRRSETGVLIGSGGETAEIGEELAEPRLRRRRVSRSGVAGRGAGAGLGRLESRGPSAGALVTSRSSSRAVACGDLATASSKAAALAWLGLVVPLTLRTYCSAAACTSCEVAGGSKLCSGRMLRHMAATVRAPRSVRWLRCEPLGEPRNLVTRAGGLDRLDHRGWARPTSTGLVHRSTSMSSTSLLTSATRPSGSGKVREVEASHEGSAQLSPSSTSPSPSATSASSWASPEGPVTVVSAGPRPGRRQPGEGPRVLLRGRVSHPPQRQRVQPGRVGQVGDVEDCCLSPPLDPLQRGVLADPEEPVVADGVQVAREAGNLQLAQRLRSGRVGQVHGVQRVGLSEGHHDREVVEPAHRLDLLARSEAAHRPDLDQLVALLAQRGDAVVLGRSTRRRGPQRPAAPRRARPSTSGRAACPPPRRRPRSGSRHR